jgi:acyl carrier protein
MIHTDKEIFNSVKSIIMDKYDGINPDDITRSSSFKHDLGFDSLDRLEIAMEFENRHNIYIEDTTYLERVSSFGEFCYILQSYVEQKPLIYISKKEQIKTKFEQIKQKIKSSFTQKYVKEK